MTIMRKIILVVLVGLCLPVLLMAQAHRDVEAWQIVWEDNFDSLNTDIWLVKDNFDHWGGELQVYTDRTDNVFIDNGNLVLRVKEEQYNCPTNYVNQWHCAREYNTGEAYDYTSGWIETQPAYNTQYGLIEARILLPYGYGFWPAFWTFKADGLGVENAAEIDIFEMLGHIPPNKITTNVHLDYCNEGYEFYPDCSAIPRNFQENLIANYAYSWHTYAIDWSPTHLRWWYDDYMFRIMPNPGVEGPVRTILNMAIEQGHPPNAQTPFPSDMRIDHVRVYELVSAVQDRQLDASNMTIFPNPATNQSTLHIKIANNIIINNLYIANNLGQTIYTSKDLGHSEIDLEIGSWPAGHYLIDVHTPEGRISKSFIK